MDKALTNTHQICLDMAAKALYHNSTIIESKFHQYESKISYVQRYMQKNCLQQFNPQFD